MVYRSKLDGPRPADRLRPEDIRDVEPDADDIAVEDWLWSRHVDPRAGADLPIEVRRVLDAHDWRTSPGHAPVEGEVDIYYEEAAKWPPMREVAPLRTDDDRGRMKKLDAEDVAAIRLEYRRGSTVSQLAGFFGVQPTAIKWHLGARRRR